MACLLLVGCGGPKAYVRPGFLDHAPTRVEVLPFVITYPYDFKVGETMPPEHGERRDVFRKIFYYALTPFGYEDVTLSDVDARLAMVWGSIEEGAWRRASPEEVGKTVGADAIIYGEISRLSHLVTPFYTETRLDASLRMVDTASGQVLWSKAIIMAERGGAALQQGQVVDFVKDQVLSFQPRVKFRRVAEAAARALVKDLPNPPMTAEASSHHEALQGVRIAVLPFSVMRKGWENGSRALRTDFAISLQESPFQLVELERVDAVLRQHGWIEGQPLPAGLSFSTLADELGADVLARGTVTNWGRGYAVVESWVKAELMLELVDPKTGEVIWSEKKKNTRQAGLFKLPAGYKAVVTAPLQGLKTSHLERVASHLTETMVHDLSTSPAVMAYLSERTPDVH